MVALPPWTFPEQRLRGLICLLYLSSVRDAWKTLRTQQFKIFSINVWTQNCPKAGNLNDEIRQFALVQNRTCPDWQSDRLAWSPETNMQAPGPDLTSERSVQRPLRGDNVSAVLFRRAITDCKYHHRLVNQAYQPVAFTGLNKLAKRSELPASSSFLAKKTGRCSKSIQLNNCRAGYLAFTANYPTDKQDKIHQFGPENADASHCGATFRLAPVLLYLPESSCSPQKCTPTVCGGRPVGYKCPVGTQPTIWPILRWHSSYLMWQRAYPPANVAWQRFINHLNAKRYLVGLNG